MKAIPEKWDFDTWLRREGGWVDSSNDNSTSSFYSLLSRTQWLPGVGNAGPGEELVIRQDRH